MGAEGSTMGSNLSQLTGGGTGEDPIDPALISTDPLSAKLFHAVAQGDIDAVQLAVGGGADVTSLRRGTMFWNGQDNPATFTAMLVACQYGHLDVAKFLFANGAAADVTRRNSHGMPPMQVRFS
jgi:ankyrin repeat protein